MAAEKTESLEDDIASVFSLLPKLQADEAARQTLSFFKNDVSLDTYMLKWAEFDLDGKFLRGGNTDILELSTSMFIRSHDDVEIHALANKVSQEGIEPGTLEEVPGEDRFLWYLPFTAPEGDRKPETRVRVLFVSQGLFQTVLDFFDERSILTQAEKRIIFQIFCNLSPKEAAAVDNVSFETKRSQLKSACSKMSCTTQGNLIGKITGKLVHLLTLSNTELPFGQITENFISRHLSSDVRLSIHRLASGRLLRVLESGPPDGKPVVMIHGMMFPIMLVNIHQHLEAAGIRLITPIRQGFLESRSLSAPNNSGELLTESFQDIASFLQRHCKTPAIILGNSLGAVLATRFANTYPHLVSRLLLLSINLTQTRPSELNPAGRFYQGMQRLSSRSDLFAQVNWQYRKYYADQQTSRHILHRLFGACPTDIAVLDGEYTELPAYEMFSDLYQSSVIGMIEDFSFIFESWRSELDQLMVPVLFLHGTDDPLTDIKEFAEISNHNSDIEISRFEGGGHFMATSQGGRIWQHVAEAIGTER